MRAIELEVLAGVEDVEAADPRADGQPPAATAPSRRGRRPPASRRPAPPPSRGRERAASRSCSASPASTRTRSPARPATAAKQSGFSRHAAYDEHRPTRPTTNSAASRDAHRAARQLAVRRARVERVEPRVDEPVESHRRAARRDHRDENPARPSPRSIGDVPRRQQRAGQRKRQREHRVAEADEREIDASVQHCDCRLRFVELPICNRAICSRNLHQSRSTGSGPAESR